MTTAETSTVARKFTATHARLVLIAAFGCAAVHWQPAARSSDSDTPALLASIRPDGDRLRADVERLASPEFGGRRGAGAVKAAALVESRFRELGLEPLFDDGSYVQAIPGHVEGTIAGRNVGGVIVGSDPNRRDEWVVISAHYDHLGVRQGSYYPGADDNASGVAAMLDLARIFSEGSARPARSLMFVGFDLEEAGLVGSRYFADHPPISLDRIKLFTTADMIARSLGGIRDGRIFVMGAEHAPGLRQIVLDAAVGVPLEVGQIGSDLLVLDRSDYGPFRARGVPYLFFSTGENPTYHTQTDVAETLDYPKLRSATRLIGRAIALAADAETLPEWIDEPQYDVSEAAAILDVMESLKSHREDLHLGPFVRRWIEVETRTLSRIVERGEMTPNERRRMVRGAQFVLITVL